MEGNCYRCTDREKERKGQFSIWDWGWVLHSVHPGKRLTMQEYVNSELISHCVSISQFDRGRVPDKGWLNWQKTQMEQKGIPKLLSKRGKFKQTSKRQSVWDHVIWRTKSLESGRKDSGGEFISCPICVGHPGSKCLRRMTSHSHTFIQMFIKHLFSTSHWLSWILWGTERYS